MIRVIICIDIKIIQICDRYFIVLGNYHSFIQSINEVIKFLSRKITYKGNL